MTKNWSEQHIISLIKSELKKILGSGANELLDDGASLPPTLKGHTRVVSCDTIQEGTDFIAHALSPIHTAGHRAIIQNLSDLSAMGAKPVGFVWSLTLPADWLHRNALKLRQFCQGVAKTCFAKKLEFYGGDLSLGTQAFSCTVTIFGDVKGKPLTRRGAQPGDLLYVSRPVGASAAGLKELLAQEDSPGPLLPKDDLERIQAHTCPDDEGAIGQALVGIASACMDISDGLSKDLYRICYASGVSAEISCFDQAVDARIRHLPESEEIALASGEEYALLFTIPPTAWEKVKKNKILARAIEIGKIIPQTKEKPQVFLHKNQELVLLEQSGYDHFSSFSLDQAPL